MSKNIIEIELDLQNHGIAVQFKVANSNKRRFILLTDGSIRLYRNLEAAIVSAKGIIGSDVEFEYFIVINKEKYFSLNDAQRINGTYQIYDGDNLYIVKETRKLSLVTAKYLVFENGDTTRYDRSYGSKRVKKLMSMVKEELKSIFTENNSTTYNKIEKREDEFVLHLRGTTAKIHILQNSQVMTINQRNREVHKKCLPFIKEMDKYTTLYVYGTIDCGEPKSLDNAKKIETILSWIISDFEQMYPELDPKYINIGVDNNIIITE